MNIAAASPSPALLDIVFMTILLQDDGKSALSPDRHAARAVRRRPCARSIHPARARSSASMSLPVQPSAVCQLELAMSHHDGHIAVQQSRSESHPRAQHPRLQNGAIMYRTLTLAALAGLIAAPALAAGGSCSTAPKSQFKPKATLEAQLTGEGLTVRQIKVEKGCYEVYAVDKAGKKVNWAYNAETLEKLDNAEAGEN
ncbi:PepSY domain-containing protein [Mesorhizobium sp. B3-2-1]|nr:PepSY domain-containing protein [Mesorhizobium sp. B3-2-1]